MQSVLTSRKKNHTSFFRVVSSKSCTATYCPSSTLLTHTNGVGNNKEGSLNDLVEVGGKRKIQALFAAFEI